MSQASTLKPVVIMAGALESNGHFEKSNWPVMFSGLGKLNAACAAIRAIQQGHTEIWNFGTVGSHKIPVGTVVSVQAAVQRDVSFPTLRLPIGAFPGDKKPLLKLSVFKELDLQEVTCGTGDCLQVPNLQDPFDVLDMEVFGLAKVCEELQVPLYSIKVVSDASKEDVIAEWKKNLSACAEKLFAEFQKIQKLRTW